MLSRRLEEVYDHDNEASKYSCIYWFFKTNTIGYYLTPTHGATAAFQEPSLAELARVIKAGACIESSFKRGKGEVGMDEYQVRTWQGWHHHMALTLIAVWFLIVRQVALKRK